MSASEADKAAPADAAPVTRIGPKETGTVMMTLYQVILGIVMLYGSLIIIANFLTDLLGLWLNPRLRASR